MYYQRFERVERFELFAKKFRGPLVVVVTVVAVVTLVVVITNQFFLLNEAVLFPRVVYPNDWLDAWVSAFGMVMTAAVAADLNENEAWVELAYLAFARLFELNLLVLFH